MPQPIPLNFDVTTSLPASATECQAITISAWLFYPDDLTLLGETPVSMTLTAGGSYDKRYHHAVIPGHPGYSAAEHLAARGNIVLLTDHLGVGQSSRLPQQRKATRHIVAQANHAATTQFHERLAAGTLHPGLPPISNVTRIGGGHSMGGMLTILQQAEHRSYDGVMIMGYTADAVHFTLHGQKLRAADHIPTGEVPDYSSNDRSALRQGFHWDDVPDTVIAADDALAVETPSGIGLDSIRAQIVKTEAGQISVPVYICLGERDVSPDSHAEPAYYRSSTDITLHILPRSGHCHTFAGTRRQMWDRMHHWARMVAGSR
jgi:alpha-beta hydrolase superfamily lysophospholipase